MDRCSYIPKYCYYTLMLTDILSWYLRYLCYSKTYAYGKRILLSADMCNVIQCNTYSLVHLISVFLVVHGIILYVFLLSSTGNGIQTQCVSSIMYQDITVMLFVVHCSSPLFTASSHMSFLLPVLCAPFVVLVPGRISIHIVRRNVMQLCWTPVECSSQQTTPVITASTCRVGLLH